MYSALSKHPLSEICRLHHLPRENFKLSFSSSLPPAHSTSHLSCISIPHPLSTLCSLTAYFASPDQPIPLPGCPHFSVLKPPEYNFLEKAYQKKFSKLDLLFFFNTHSYIFYPHFCDKVRFVDKILSFFHLKYSAAKYFCSTISASA